MLDQLRDVLRRHDHLLRIRQLHRIPPLDQTKLAALAPRCSPQAPPSASSSAAILIPSAI
jgi:hypothetical protein